VNVLALLGLLLLLLALGVVVSELQTVSDWIDNNNDELLCAVYSSTDAATAVAAVTTLVQGGSLTAQQQTLALYWVSQAAINEAFSNANVPALGADCTECVCPEYGLSSGIEVVAPLVQVDSVDNGNRHEMYVNFNWKPGEFCGPEITLNDVTWLSGVDCATDNWFYTRAYDSQLNLVFSQQGTCSFETFRATLPRSDISRVSLVRSYPQTYSHSPFSVGFDWSP
jgi:hypothetical protein